MQNKKKNIFSYKACDLEINSIALHLECAISHAALFFSHSLAC